MIQDSEVKTPSLKNEMILHPSLFYYYVCLIIWQICIKGLVFYSTNVWVCELKGINIKQATESRLFMSKTKYPNIECMSPVYCMISGIY